MNKEMNIKLVLMLSFVSALGGFLFGFDTAVISGTISFAFSFGPEYRL